MSNSVVGPGDIIAGRYRIERLLGQGGMGSVYEAVQLSLQRRVALKLLVDEALERPAQAARFEREAVALARLTDPHTVRLFDFGADERRRPFLVMELLKGFDLAGDLARHGLMRWDQALQVSRQVLASLAEAHGAGIIHRDIKPANLFLCAGPEWPAVRVLDFGIAAASGEDRAGRKLTLTGAVLGSAAYMAPEQAQGHEAGPAADLYALGVVLFELLTQNTPFDGRSFTAQLLAKVMDRAPGLREVRPELDIPDGVQALVAELLERDAAARPASARAVAERMTTLLEGASLPALVRAVDAAPAAPAAPAATQPLAFPRTEPMLVPPTLDHWWAPPKTVPLHEARPVARAARGRRALAASALLVSAGVLGWELGLRPRSDGNASALETGSPSPALSSKGPSPGAGMDVPTEEVRASAAATAREDITATSASESVAAVAGSTGTVSPSARASARPGRLARAKAPPASGRLAPKAASAAPARVPEPGSPESEVAALPPWPAQLPEAVAVLPFTQKSASSPRTPSADAMQLPRAAIAAPPRSQRYLRTVEAATAAERSGEITPIQSDGIIAALRERRLFARSRAIRQYREGLIGNAELQVRLREIDREFEGRPRWREQGE